MRPRQSSVSRQDWQKGRGRGADYRLGDWNDCCNYCEEKGHWERKYPVRLMGPCGPGFGKGQMNIAEQQ